MPDFAYDRITEGLLMPGVFVVGNLSPVRQVIDELLLIDACSEHLEWNTRVLFLPL